MKPKRPAARLKKTSAANSLAPRLAAYSATAAAALAFAPNAHAQVIPITSFDYSGLTNTTTPPSFTLPTHLGTLNFNAGPFRFSFRGLHDTTSAHATLGGQLIDPNRLLLHSAIKPNSFGNPAQLAFRSHSGYNTRVFYGTNNPATGYVGFKGANAGHNYYGWFNIKVTNDANGFPFPNTISLVAKNGDPGVFGAYEISTAPGINAFGAGDILAVPEPANSAFGLGLLAFGAAGVREMRRRRKLAA